MIGVHRPSVPAWHVPHFPEHAESQHTPVTQKPELQELDPLHAAPSMRFGTQVLASQNALGAQK